MGKGLFGGLFSGLKQGRGTVDAAPAEPLWAIGDIHGCLDLLQRLIEHVQARGSDQPPRVIFLGDYVDRGPHSRGVLDALVNLEGSSRIRAEFIRGNHDHVMQNFLADPQAGPAWQGMGADATLASYGVSPPPPGASPEVWAEAQARFVSRVPSAHVGFLARLKPSVQSGDYFFTHAGVRPGRPLAKQKLTDLMWVRNVFLEDRRPLEKVVVHGHTPTADPYSDHRRVGVDTGAYASGVLTALYLEDKVRQFAQAFRHPAEVGGVGVRAYLAAPDP